MRNAFTLLSLSLLTLTLHAQTGWNSLPNAPTSQRIDDIFFVNTDTGVAATAEGKIYKTENAGTNWSLKFSSASNYMRSTEFLNDSVGFAGTLYGDLFKTVDGGDTWTDISNLLNPNVSGICGLNAVSDSIIYGVGIWFEPAYVIKSTNSGQTWSYTDMSSLAHGLVDVYFFSPDTGFVTGIGLDDQAIIFYTDDGGATWATKYSGNDYSTYAWKIQFLNRRDAVACIASTNASTGSEMIMSSDSGMTWQLKTVTPMYHELEGIGFMNKAHGWVGGYFNGMYETVDSGATWNLISAGKDLNRYFKINDTLLYACGHSVYKFIDTATTIATDVSEPFVPIHTLDAVYPNPASDEITISYTLHNKTMVDLALYDDIGRRVIRFVHQHQDGGKYSLQPKINSLPAGKYFITLNTNEGAVVSDFIRIER
ncbi:MAG TPA: T9SS type A sorting domain-containing protein [Chitinophagales bacterium]|nr:T9SS type A sorting domain-containing protein [Chitinophagales bacterium]